MIQLVFDISLFVNCFLTRCGRISSTLNYGIALLRVPKFIKISTRARAANFLDL